MPRAGGTGCRAASRGADPQSAASRLFSTHRRLDTIVEAAGKSAQCHLVIPDADSWSGAALQSCAGRPRPASFVSGSWTEAGLETRCRTGVLPHGFCPVLRKLSGIGRECLRHHCTGRVAATGRCAVQQQVMKVVAISGSARRDGNTAILLRHVLGELEKEGVETELVQLSGKKIHGCLACRECSKNKDRRCAQKDDFGNECIAKMDAADGIILGSPTYVADISPEIKGLIDRACLVARGQRGHVPAQGGRGGGGGAARRGDPRLRRAEPLLPDQRDDRARLFLLEHRDRPRDRRGRERRRGDRDDAYPWPQYGLG